MPHHKCQYRNCVNNSEDMSMFRFPVNDEPRLKLWVQHSGNKKLKSLTQEEWQRRRLYLCENHFKVEDIGRNTFRSRLVSTAVPLSASEKPRQVRSDIKHTYKPRPKVSKEPVMSKEDTPPLNNEDPIPDMVPKPEMPVDVPAVSELPVLQEVPIEPRNNEDPIPDMVPKPKMSVDVPAVSELPVLQGVPIEPYIPKDEPMDDEYDMNNSCCKDCAAFTDGFPFWCVQCGRGPLCASCAECAPHDSHFLLRTPRGAPRSQTEAVLEVIRQQLQAENLLELYEVNVDCVKVEIKEEPQELPLEFDDPDSQDPLDSDTGEQVVADETNNQTLTKRRRIMPTENNAIQPKTLVKLLPVSDSSTGSKTNLKPTAIGLKNILLTPVASGSQPEETTPDGHNNSQNAASSKKRKSQTQTILNMIPSDQLKTIQQETPEIRKTQTVIKNPTDKDPQTKNPPGKLRIKRTLLKVPLSEFTKSTTLNPSSFKALSNVELSDIRKSQSIKKTLSDQLKNLPQSNDIREAQTVLKSPTDIKDPQSNSQPEKLKIKRTFLKVPLSELTQSKILNPGGSKTLRKLEPGDILNLEQVQKLLKRPDVEQSDHEGQKLKKVLKGFSTPLKVTSESSRRSK